MFSSFWPLIADAPEGLTNPALNVVNREFSRQYRSIPKIVVSDSLEVRTDNPWRDTTEVVSRAGISSRLRAERTVDGGDIAIFGSRILWNALLVVGMLDELHLIVGPAAIGDGIPLLMAPTRLSLIESRRLDGSSNALLRYSIVG
jgi:dihydrofolate reductase